MRRLSPVHEAPTREERIVNECRDCGAPVLWAISKNGKSILLDAEPLEPGKGRFVLYGEQAQFAPEDGEYTCHWDTCPNRQEKPKDDPVVECPKCGHRFVGRGK